VIIAGNPAPLATLSKRSIDLVENNGVVGFFENIDSVEACHCENCFCATPFGKRIVSAAHSKISHLVNTPTILNSKREATSSVPRSVEVVEFNGVVGYFEDTSACHCENCFCATPFGKRDLPETSK